jgi:hypothetical protein
VHQALDGVDAVVVAEDAIHGGATVALSAGEALLLHAGDQFLEQGPDTHVLGNV